MCDESARITGTDPGSSPSRAAARTLTDLRQSQARIADEDVSRAGMLSKK